MKLINYSTQKQSVLPDLNEPDLKTWLSEQGYDFDNTLALATEDFWVCGLQVYYNFQTGQYGLHQPSFHALIEDCLYVSIPSEAAVEDLSEVLSQRLETLDSHLNPDRRIQIVSPYIDRDPYNSSRRHSLQLWLVFRSCEYELGQPLPDPSTQPLLDVDHVFFGVNRDDDDRFIGYFVATRRGLDEDDLLSKSWREQGWELWKQESLSEWSSGCWEGDERIFNLFKLVK